jgi:hypothetical protein
LEGLEDKDSLITDAVDILNVRLTDIEDLLGTKGSWLKISYIPGDVEPTKTKIKDADGKEIEVITALPQAKELIVFKTEQKE